MAKVFHAEGVWGLSEEESVEQKDFPTTEYA